LRAPAGAVGYMRVFGGSRGRTWAQERSSLIVQEEAA